VDANALVNAAKAHFDAGRFQEALRLMHTAVSAEPNSPQLWNNCGTVLALMRHFEDAEESFSRALTLAPDFLSALLNRAQARMQLRRYADAARDYEALLALNPDVPFARGALLRAKLQACDWQGLPEQWQSAREEMRAGKPVLTPMVATALCEEPEDQLLASRILASVRFSARTPFWTGERYRHERIRLAYVSADFHAHATAALTAGLFENHDKTRFETFAISFGRHDGSAMRKRVESAFEHFLDVQDKSDLAIAQLIRESEIDIAVDLKGYTDDSRPGIFAHRPAPLQASFLGFPATMGGSYIDYIIADAVVIPPEDRVHYSEKVVHLPHSYQPNDRARERPAASRTRAEAGLPDDGFVFCCFNNVYKITPGVFAVWMRLLRDVPGSVLWLLEDNDTAMRNLKREAGGHGIEPERLIFAPRATPEAHLARHRLADLFLDTAPYNAHTTASDALWMGLPLVTCAGRTFPSRVAAGLLRAVGLPELVTSSAVEYEDLARALAHDPERLASLKTKLEKNRETAPLFDTARYTRNLESALLTMWERHQRGDPPESFGAAESVAPPPPASRAPPA
jgi:predicted O-linked N-acetylglucosamine transferase (SPINDLY family)